VSNVFSAAASGTLDLSTGDSATIAQLLSSTFVTGNVGEPCARCRDGGGTGAILNGSPASPKTGNCDRTAGHPACTTTNSVGLSRDCPAAGIAVGTINVNLSPLTTAVTTHTDPAGNFCPNQGTATPGTSGCFGLPTCVSITEKGSPAGPITPNVAANATLAYVFCIPPTGGIVDAAADLPGPGALALPGMFVVH
jgi:hypothetical protein